VAAERLELPARLTRALTRIEPVRLSRTRDESAEAARRKPTAREAAPAVAETKAKRVDVEEDAPVDELFQRVETTRFLGPEFLLWIWLRGEFLQAGIDLGDAGEFNVWIDQQLTLESALDKNERVTIRGVAPADGNEAREAVRSRKFPVRCRVVLHGQERESVFSLIAPRFAIAGGVVPAVPKQDASEAFLERMALAEKLFLLVDRLYAAFLADRLSENWKLSWEPAIFAWLEGDSVPAAVLQRLAPAVAREPRAKRRNS